MEVETGLLLGLEHGNVENIGANFGNAWRLAKFCFEKIETYLASVGVSCRG